MKQCLLLYKAHRHPPRPPPRRKAGGPSSPLSEGKNCRAGFRTQRAGVGSDGKREKIGACPSSFPPPDLSAIPTSAASAPPFFRESGTGTTRNAGEGSFLKESLREQAYAVTTGSQLPRELTLLALLSSRQHTDCVYPQQRGTHSL